MLALLMVENRQLLLPVVPVSPGDCRGDGLMPECMAQRRKLLAIIRGGMRSPPCVRRYALSTFLHRHRCQAFGSGRER
jgi:hypothetical protein